MEEGIPNTTVVEGTDLAREVRLRHCVHWTVAMAIQSHMSKQDMCVLFGVYDLSIFTTRITVTTLEIRYIMWPFVVQYILIYNLYSLSIF
jgi:hypothetical protein